MKDIGDGPKAAGSHTTGAGVTAVHRPKHEVALVWIQLQQQHHSLTTQLVNLEEIIPQLSAPIPATFYPLISQYLILVYRINISVGTKICCKPMYFKYKPATRTTKMDYALTKTFCRR